MDSVRSGLSRLAWCLLVSLSASPAFAQSQTAIVVRDATGAVLPGVTVEASSPALIETSDGHDGQSRPIQDHRPASWDI
jgi:hypothetical protein